MRKLLSFIVLLVISSTLSFGQNLTVKPTTVRLDQKNDNQNLEQYFNKNVVSDSKVTIWSSNMSNASQWVAAKLPSQEAIIANTWEWKSDTSQFSTYFKQYVGPYMGSTTPMQGVFYFDGISNLIASKYGISNSTLTNATAINTTGYNAVSIKFYQLYKSYNADSSLLEISSDNVNWYTIDVNPNVAVNNYSYTWKEYNISQWAANKAQVWIRFRFFAPASTTSGAQYGGGYGWALDDVQIFEPANNQLQVDRVTLHDGYTNIPTGIGMPMYYDATFMNIGALTQTHVKLHGVALATGADSTSIDTTAVPGQNITISLKNYFYTPPTALGTYKITSYISTDNIPRISQDTFSIKVVCDTCKYGMDNNTYVSSRWAGTTGTTCDPYTAVNRFEVNANKMAYGVNCVVNNATKAGSKIKAVLYKWQTSSATRTIVAQSSNYYITADKIPAAPMVNPPSIALSFTSGYQMQLDSLYWIGIQVFGGTDTVKMATDNTGIPQYEQTSLFFDPVLNSWYLWAGGNVPAVMIRTVFNQNDHWDNITGINEINSTVSLFSCMPNPANNSTQISYELKNSEKTSIIITDIMGRTVKTLNQGLQTKGNYTIDVDLSGFTSGTYFYTLKTPSAQATDKLIIVKR
ncbi:MAG: T9SS type A sorting domain-containing protein [Bacteroidales bacterium]